MGDRFGFPHGTGASSRVTAYAKGLQAAGARVHVLCVEPSEDAARPLNQRTHGSYDGVEFSYTYGRTSRPPQRVRRLLLRLLKWPRFLAVAVTWGRSNGGLDAVLVYSLSLPWLAAAWVLCRLTGATFIHEDCELPFYWHTKRASVPIARWLYYHVAFRAFDGCLAISTFMERLCLEHLRAGAKVLRVPILVDANAPPPSVEPGENVVFCGLLDHREVLGLLDIFARVAGAFPAAHLRLVGDAHRQGTVAKLRRQAEELGIGDRIELAGHVTRDGLPAELARARVLVLPRPSGAFSQAGLPTKVAEYLVSGRPVVVSANGDLPLYLTDGTDAYLVPPDDHAAFAASLRRALAEPDESTAIGARGRETALREFDEDFHGGRILGFIAELRGH